MLIVAGLVGATVGPAMAQLASEDLDPVSERVEVEQHGFAVTFPDDWDVRHGPAEWPTTDRRIYTSAIDKIQQQLRKHKEKVQSRHRNTGHRQQGDAGRPAPPNP